MDIVHHAAIGAVGMLAAGSLGHELAGLGFLAGSVFPDLDVAFLAAGKRFYLKRHQGPTHSLPLAPVYAALLAAVAAIEVGWQWSLYLGIVAGLAVHVALDLANTFGIQLFWPLSMRRHCIDAVFFVDLGAWTLTLAALAALLSGAGDPAAIALAYAAAFAAYVLARALLQRRVRARTGAAIVIPSSWNPFGFFLLRRDEAGVRTSLYDALRGRELDVRRYDPVAQEVRALAGTSPVYRDMSGILRGLEVTRVDRDARGTTLVAQDLAIRNFGGRFGRTELRFDAEGRLQREMANI